MNTNSCLHRLSRQFRYLASALLLLSPFAAAQPQPAQLELIPLNDDLYVIYNEIVPGNVTALITDDGVLLVDNKFDWDYDNITRLLGTVTDQPIRYVINTHYHGDHTGGNRRMQETGTEVIASLNARIKMVEAEQPGLPNITVDDRGYVHVGGKTVEIHALGRAHTDGDVVVLFPDHGVIAMGDMFTYGDAVPQLIDYSGGGSARAWTRTLDRVLALNFETVVPGHGVVTDRGALQDFRESTLHVQNRVREVLADGGSRDDVERMLRAEFHWADLHLNRGLDGIIAEMR